MVNHGISRPAHTRRKDHGRFAPRWLGRGFTDRYVFPDGELHEVGTVVSAMQHAGFEVRHLEANPHLGFDIITLNRVAA